MSRKLGRKKLRKSTGYVVDENQWNDSLQKLTLYLPNSSKVDQVATNSANRLLKRKITHLKKHVHKLIDSEIDIDKDNWFNIEFLDSKGEVKIEYKELEFFAFVDNLIDEGYKRLNPSTLKTYTTALNSLKEFWDKDKLYLESQIDLNFIEEYRFFLAKRKGYSHNTQINLMKKFKTWCKRAFDTGFTKKYPFSKYSIGTFENKPRFLIYDHFMLLKNLYFENKDMIPERYIESTRAFLWSCFTGMAMIDIRNFDYGRDVHSDVISIRRQKTNQSYKVPLNKTAKQILKDVEYKFKLKSNQKINQDLKVIASLIGIQKEVNLEFHMARHTFGTLLVKQGVKLIKIRDLMGHQSIRTTEIYARVYEELQTDEIGTLDNL